MSTCKATVILGKTDICKDCMKSDVCKHKANLDKDPIIGMAVERCEYFKDKSKFIELPCKVGDTVYLIPTYNYKPYCGIQEDKVQMIGITSRGIHIKARNHHEFNKMYMLGKTVFLTKEEAEKALAERNTPK